MYGILGDHIYELRIGCGWSMDFTARKLGVSKSTYQHWEKYGVFPSVSRLIQICKVFHMSADYLLGLGEKQMNLDGLDAETTGLMIRLAESLAGQKRDGI